MTIQKIKKIVVCVALLSSLFFKNSRTMDDSLIEQELSVLSPKQQKKFQKNFQLFQKQTQEQIELAKLLHEAASQDNFNAVKNLVEAKADINVQYQDKSPLQTSLHYTLVGYHNPAQKIQITRFLCGHRADINYEGNFKSPLSLAVCQSSYETVEYLLVCKADPTKSLKNKNTLVGELLKATWDKSDYCGLKHNNNIREEKLRLLTLLLESKIDPNITPLHGTPPLFWALAHDLKGARWSHCFGVKGKDGCGCNLTATLLSYGATIHENLTDELREAIDYSRNSTLWRTLLYAKVLPSREDAVKPFIKEELAIIAKKEKAALLNTIEKKEQE